MSITDSTTTLDTAWTQQDVAVFTSGVLSTISTCVSEVESKLRRGTLSSSTVPTQTQVKNWLKRAKLEFAEAKRFQDTRKYAYADLVAETYRYALPPDYAGFIKLHDITNDRDITLWDESKYDKLYPDPSEESEDEVMVACIKGMELWVAPPPDSADRIELEYHRSGAETTSDDFSWIPELYRFRCCDFAIGEAFESLHDFRKSDRFKGKWEFGVKKMREGDGRRKWRGKHKRCLTVFEEYAAKRYQP